MHYVGWVTLYGGERWPVAALWNAIYDPWMHARVTHRRRMVRANPDDLVVECQCQSLVVNPTPWASAPSSQWSKRDLRNYKLFPLCSKCQASLIYHFCGLISGVFLAVLWPRWGAICLRQPSRLRPDGFATPGLRVVLLCRPGLSETLSREAALLRSLLHHIHTMVRLISLPLLVYGQNDTVVGKCTFHWFTSHHCNHWYSVK